MNDSIAHELNEAMRPTAQAAGPPGPVLAAAARARKAAQARRLGALAVLALVPVAGLALVSVGVPMFSGSEALAPAIASGDGQAGQQEPPSKAPELAANPEFPATPSRARPHPDSLLALSRGDGRPPEAASGRSVPDTDLVIRAGSLRRLQESGMLGPADIGTDTHR